MPKKQELTFSTIIAILKGAINPTYFIGRNNEPLIQYELKGKKLTTRIRSKSFKSLLINQLKAFGEKVKSHEFENILDEFEALCHESGIKKEAFIRVGYDDENIIIDLNNDDNQFVYISKREVKIVKNTDVPFIRPLDQSPLPIPLKTTPENFLHLYLKYFNPKHLAHNHIHLAFTLKLLYRNLDSCGFLVFQGKQDSGKSTSTEAIKFLIDPSESLLSTPPKTPEDIAFLLNSTYLAAFDNLSGINNEMADYLCSLAYGVTFYKRKHYTDDTLNIYNTMRDLLFNGIEELSNRADLNDRIIEIELDSIDPKKRKSKTTLNQELVQDRPYILYGLYNLLSNTLAHLPSIRTTGLPRMSDFVRIGMAMYKAMGKNPEHFLEIYNEILRDKKSSSFWNDPLCCQIHKLLMNKLQKDCYLSKATPVKLEGTALELMNIIFIGDAKKNCPKTPRGFSAYLKRMEGLLKTEGIIYVQVRTSGRREISIFFDDDTFNQLISEQSNSKSTFPPNDPVIINRVITYEKDQTTEEFPPDNDGADLL